MSERYQFENFSMVFSQHTIYRVSNELSLPVKQCLFFQILERYKNNDGYTRFVVKFLPVIMEKTVNCGEPYVLAGHTLFTNSVTTKRMSEHNITDIIGSFVYSSNKNPANINDLITNIPQGWVLEIGGIPYHLYNLMKEVQEEKKRIYTIVDNIAHRGINLKDKKCSLMESRYIVGKDSVKYYMVQFEEDVRGSNFDGKTKDQSCLLVPINALKEAKVEKAEAKTQQKQEVEEEKVEEIVNVIMAELNNDNEDDFIGDELYEDDVQDEA